MNDKSERNIYLLRDVMKLQQGRGHSENMTRVRVHSLLLLQAHMLEASLPGLWSLRSQSVLLTDAHINFAEGAAGLCRNWL